MALRALKIGNIARTTSRVSASPYRRHANKVTTFFAEMSIPMQGIYSRSGGLISAIYKQLRCLNLKPVSKITVQFDPFGERVQHARDFIYYISAPKLLSTNLFCVLKTNVVCNRSEPQVTCDLASGEKIIFKLGNLDTIDILKLYNKHVSSLVPKEVPVETGRPKKRKKLRIKTKIPRHRR